MEVTDLITEARELCEKWSLSDYAVFECEDCIANMVIYKVAELCDALEKAQAEIERLREAQRWVPMSERFPTEKDADRLGFIIAHSDSMGQSTVCVWHHVLDDGVTSHWMMLPAPPEEGAEHERD